MSQINTNTIANEAGTGGPDFVGMPSVGGDPVVESGSNTDGEWTRWADGTQICYKILESIYAIDSTWGSGYISPAITGGPWPVPFSSLPSKSAVKLTSAASTIMGGQSSVTAVDAGNHYELRLIVAASDSQKTGITGFGRWK